MGDDLRAHEEVFEDPGGLTAPVEKPLPELSDSVVVAGRARDGDEAALASLFSHYQERLARIVRIELGAELGRFVEPEDVVQEVFLVVRRRFHEFELKSHSGFLAWLVAIAKHKVKDKRREMKAAKRDHRREVPIHGTAQGDEGATHVEHALPASTTGPSTRAWKLEFRNLMDRTLNELPENYQRILLLREYYGAEWDEIEREMGRGKHACEQLHQRAWTRLKIEVLKKMRQRE